MMEPLKKKPKKFYPLQNIFVSFQLIENELIDPYISSLLLLLFSINNNLRVTLRFAKKNVALTLLQVGTYTFINNIYRYEYIIYLLIHHQLS